ncbi:DUF4396 domain-containing protein [Streptomyces sp. NPDC056500]|uniref:DUF4396 domain-containing protein n=1 Tax=Streptomyces sp. NPDC056500 TaxID=3345840 RepID=UPI003678182C
MQHDAHAHRAGHDRSADGTSHQHPKPAHPEHAEHSEPDPPEHAEHSAHTGHSQPEYAPGRADHSGHDSHTGHGAEGGVSWSMAARATLHCLIGCAIGEVLGMVIGTALGWHNVPTMALAIFLAFIFGYSFTMITILRAGLSFRAAVKVALAADTLSILVMEITDNSVLALWPGAMHAQLSDGLFWYALAIAFAVAFLITTPVNKWLIGRGKGHAVMHQFH